MTESVIMRTLNDTRDQTSPSNDQPHVSSNNISTDNSYNPQMNETLEDTNTTQVNTITIASTKRHGETPTSFTEKVVNKVPPPRPPLRFKTYKVTTILVSIARSPLY